ncbi:OsmC family protein [Saccharopolyspora sp. NFXS83]|uniref:OsmC family protein n=1 Tax=Saccharopolyspora sp. NFXS83 TaxID=2993560 RepID=UPI00224AFDEB|nr:OsmC family protein [Saccharopolyspora sp. NFXS83]MCX2730438.1 OsmC family protein [Saccharopolyspora sp. NFXS83]
MPKSHDYAATVTWTGNTGSGTTSFRDFSRDHVVEVAGKPRVEASADAAFLGDPARLNPEDLLVASLSECHLLTYLALCSNSGVVVLSYRDEVRGVMAETPGGGGRFTEVVLRPEVVVAEESMFAKAERLHERAHRDCFIANSVNFPVRHEPQITVGS